MPSGLHPTEPLMRCTLAFRVAAFWLLLGLLVGGPALRAQDVQPVPPLSGRVIDTTATLTAAAAAALSARLESLETRRGAQVVVLIVPGTAPEDIAAYAQRIADTWKIGRRAVGDGVLVVVAKNDRTVRIEVAKSLEGAIPDLAASRIITEQIVPAFRAGNYAGGLAAAVDRLDERIAGEGLPVPEAAPSRSTAPRSGRGFDLHDLAIFLFVAVPMLGALTTRLAGRTFGALLTGAGVGGVAWWLTASALLACGAGVIALFLVGVMGLGAAGRGGRGGLGPVIWGGGGFGGGFGSGRGGGGGFSSGGGGDFGGGGASGRW